MKHLLAACLVLIGGTANALSCFPADPAYHFQFGADPNPNVRVVKGRFSYRTIAQPLISRLIGQTAFEVQASFDGTVLGQDGFTEAFKATVTLKIDCFDVFCGGVSKDHDVIAFIEGPDHDLRLPLRVCNHHVFSATQEIIVRLTDCRRGRDCAPGL